MRQIVVGFTMVVALFALTVGAPAEEKEVTLKGTITCAKCDLKVAKSCATVIKVKEDDKDVVYWFDTEGHKKHHREICTTPKKGSVTGTVSEKDDKKVIDVKSVKFD